MWSDGGPAQPVAEDRIGDRWRLPVAGVRCSRTARSRTSRAALAPFGGPQIATSAELGDRLRPRVIWREDALLPEGLL
jgi:hypothetical protein